LQSARNNNNNNNNNNSGAGNMLHEAAVARAALEGSGNNTHGTNLQVEREILGDFYKLLQATTTESSSSGLISGSAQQQQALGGSSGSNLDNTGNSNLLRNNGDLAGRFGGGLNDNGLLLPFATMQQQQQQHQQHQQQQQQQHSQILRQGALDNLDLGLNQFSASAANLSNSDAAMWLALQQYRQQQQQQRQHQQQFNVPNGLSDHLAAMLPSNHNRLGAGGGNNNNNTTALSLMNVLGSGGLNSSHQSALAAALNNGSDAQQQSQLLAALLGNSNMVHHHQLDASHGSGGSISSAAGLSFHSNHLANGQSCGNMAASAPMMQAAVAGAAARKAPPTTTAANHAPPEQQPQRPVLPFRALSAYNFFFRDERDRIINGGEHEFTPSKKQKLLSEHWFRDRSVKRRHRKTHGKIAFTTLSKVISQGWRDLPEDKRAFYREVAAEDLDRYQRELDQFKLLDAAHVGDVAAALFASANGTSATSNRGAAGVHDDLDDGSSRASNGPSNRAKAA
jgi:hypothetical protein